MAVYTFHLPRDAAPGDARALEDAVLVRDGFSWGAFIFQVLWCLWNRLWLVALGFVLVSAALSFSLEWAGLPQAAIVVAGVLLAILFALEANNLRRLSLERRGLALRGVVVAPDLHEAERRAFSLWLDPQAEAAAHAAAEAAPSPSAPARSRTAPHGRDPFVAQDREIIGLFPAAEEPR